MSESSDEARAPDDSQDDSEAEDVQTLRRRVEEKFDFDCTNVGIDQLATEFIDDPTESQAMIANGSGEFLPFGDESFDVVISHNVLTTSCLRRPSSPRSTASSERLATSF